MEFRKSYFFLLTLLLVFVLQIGGQSSVYAFSASHNVALESTLSINQEVGTDLNYDIGDNQSLVAEISEEISEEEEKTLETFSSLAATHAYYTSYLRFLTFSPTSKIQYFDTSSLVSTTPIYLQNEVFRI